MNNAGLPGKSQQAAMPPFDDIPEALRDTPVVELQPQLKQTPSLQQAFLKRVQPYKLTESWALTYKRTAVGLGAIATLALTLWSLQQAHRSRTPILYNEANSSAEDLSESDNLTSQTNLATASSPTAQAPKTLLGHHAYEEAPPEALRSISADGVVKLRPAAAEKYLEMVAAARADGVRLVAISGFRSLEDQQYLFFDLKAEQGQATTRRAEVSAPPGYSEHHTGYAIDLADGSKPETNLEISFETTPAFKWLQENAVRYSFEMSFPKDNPQGLSYEPWHWRFVGDRQSLETFFGSDSTSLNKE